MPLLPKIETVYDISPLQKDLALTEPGLRQILAGHGLGNAALSLMAGGSMALFGVNDDLVLKLFPDICRSTYETEVSALRELAGKTSFEIPKLMAAGTSDSWCYVLMSRVRGVQLDTVWKDLDDAKKEIVCENLGRAVAELHRIPVSSPDAAGLWRTFLEEQDKHCVERQRHHGLQAELLAQIPEYIRPALEFIKAAPPVFLHTEIMPAHIFIDPERLTIESLIDFEPSMKGAAEYDFGAVAIFVTEAQPRLFRAFLRGYGYHVDKAVYPSARLIMICTLLHRYSRLPWYLDRLEGERAKKITELSELENKWFTSKPIVRHETAADVARVRAVVCRAFGRQSEADLVDGLRQANALVVSAVADLGGQIVGHVGFSPITIGGQHAALALAPVAVDPASQRAGTGTALIRWGLEECARLGHRVVVVLGSPAYYRRFGFTPASGYGIECPFPAPAEDFMVLEISPGAAAGYRGIVRYRSEFEWV